MRRLGRVIHKIPNSYVAKGYIIMEIPEAENLYVMDQKTILLEYPPAFEQTHIATS